MRMPEPAVVEAMKDLVRQCEDGQVIYRARRGDCWLCEVQRLEVTETAFAVDLKPLRRVDTAMWRQQPLKDAFTARCPWWWAGLELKRHALVCMRYVDWCITFDPQIVAEIIAMAEAPKMPVGDLLSLLRHLEIE
jgi:hypothetical protein